jgi:Domain of unknown function DUF11
LLFLAAPSAEAATPAWSLQLAHTPASFERLEREVRYGVQFTVAVENSGDEVTAGAYVLDDVLPPQLTVADISPGSGWTCTPVAQVVGGAPLSCSSNEELAPGASALAVTVRMNMSNSAPALLTNEATVSGGGAAGASATDFVPVVDRPPFNIEGFTARATTDADTEYTVAGGHPYQVITGFALPLYAPAGGVSPVQDLNEAYVELPAGLIASPAATPRCPLVKLQSAFPLCPVASQVGVIHLGVSGVVNQYPIYNVVPERGYPAEFAFKFGTFAATIYPVLRPRTGTYGITLAVPGVARFGVTSIGITLYGVPSEVSGVGEPKLPLISNPANCGEAQPLTKVAIDSWQFPGQTFQAEALGLKSPDLSDPNWKTATVSNPPVTECDAADLVSQFRPSIDAQPVQGSGPVQADQPAGLKVDLDFHQSNDPTNPGETFDPSIPQAPEMKNATVKLPVGVSISPSAADGLVGCSDLASDPAGDQVDYSSTFPVTCPDASKIGTASATSPLLAAHDPATDAITGPEPIAGDIYLIKPHPGDLGQDDGGDGTFRLLIQLESSRYGINVKLPATAEADKTTGRLTVTLDESPQLPISHLELRLDSGPRALLATPPTCGSFTATTDLEPWSSPGTPDATPSSSFAVDSGPNGSACSATVQGRPFNPPLSAGSEGSAAGAASPFVLGLSRRDGEQELGSISAALPLGLSAKVAGIPYCSEDAIAAAEDLGGRVGQSSAGCPAPSQVGTLQVGAGAGPTPFYLSGKAYLAGPYKGAPLSLVFITPAVAGPFDLGNVVIRAALSVDPRTAQVTVTTGPLPQILDGVPPRLRDIRIHLDRPDFILNPTSCASESVSASVVGSSGAGANPSVLFQVGECDRLHFKPRLALRLLGATHRGAHPTLRATLAPRPGDANIGRATLTLPRTELLDNSHIRTICTRARYAAHTCPDGSIYGYAKAWSPLLGEALQGPVYLRSSSHRLPDLVASLDGQIDIDLVGRISSVGSRIRATFPQLPDVPLSRFVLTMRGGKKGLLANNTDLCRALPRATATLRGQNGRRRTTHRLMVQRCGKERPR